MHGCSGGRARDVAACELPDADLLVYGFGKRWTRGRPMFSPTMARHFTRTDTAGSDVVHVECEALYQPVSQLLELGAHRNA